ncbi:hypothetical protein HOD05_04190 [Candidatus Woesearchaeota archaeon]|jgi:mRNA-degrading endonuclease RelE of RelBE toxin-antitoxin system|nr:hypothetical protein [Candidatus Woesearchaeota archaeon]MBT4150714.1 hypothetical protein [Candidatus Woesearchaeota archaeon]MBT4247534.1 hypothetical protein [Candidatus Woesearchaeota archaeon]MBT4434395.1 hypothetical protein [Candidatus Woesearchaeota archaeon]
MFKVIGTDTYLFELKKFSKQEQDEASKIPKELAQNPFIGKPLNYKFLREKKIGGKRIYFLVYEDLSLVLLVATSTKKNQQATIEHLKTNLPEFKRIAEKIFRQVL